MDGEATLRLAFSFHAHLGGYALLIGSGVSRAAGILTGWDIVLDLIRKVAMLLGEAPSPDPERWYIEKFGEPPDYAKLLDKLTRTSSERMALLRAYFEPTDEERAQGIKVPTVAHRAIATLVRLGYIRIILTTNFDRLIEWALEAEGVVPDVISSDDGLSGALPYVHARCYVVKLHGDYRDIRLKNTPEELAVYSKPFNVLLDRVFDEFGLVVCGWSAAWDTALRSAILRCPTRRYTTFWLTRGLLGDEARELTRSRRAEMISIDGAEAFFPMFLEVVKSLRELERPDPRTTAVALATVKRYLVDPMYRVQLHDIFHEESERVWQELGGARFEATEDHVMPDAYQRRMHQGEAVVERLMAMVAALSYHDPGAHAHLLQQCVERLLQPPKSRGRGPRADLWLYPALLILYASGICALTAKRFRGLAAVLREPTYRGRDERDKVPAVEKLNAQFVFQAVHNEVSDALPGSGPLRPSQYLSSFLRSVLYDYLPDEVTYQETFDLFEYLLALTYLDLHYPDLEVDPWLPMEQFMRHFHGIVGLFEREWEGSPMAEFVSTGLEQGIDWELLQAGFFRGSIERFQLVVGSSKKWTAKVLRRWS
jgi:SIR2-like domain